MGRSILRQMYHSVHSKGSGSLRVGKDGRSSPRVAQVLPESLVAELPILIHRQPYILSFFFLFFFFLRLLRAILRCDRVTDCIVFLFYFYFLRLRRAILRCDSVTDCIVFLFFFLFLRWLRVILRCDSVTDCIVFLFSFLFTFAVCHLTL